MYKLVLCLRYLRTRYIALASIISVMLGVATLVIVNSVMGGFVFLEGFHIRQLSRRRRFLVDLQRDKIRLLIGNYHCR